MKSKAALALLPLLAAPSAFAQTPAKMPAVISACVGKFGGFVRIVAATSACDVVLETPIQWNQQGPAGATGPTGQTGPQGPTGPTGPAGLGLAHIIPVPINPPTSATAQKGSGPASPILTILASITDASASNRYELLLDAGTYNIESAPGDPVGLTLPRYISLKGAGPGVTFLNTPSLSLAGDNTLSGFGISGYPTIFTASSLLGATLISQVNAPSSIANFATTSTGVALTVRDSSFLLFTTASTTVSIFLTGDRFQLLTVPSTNSICLADYVESFVGVPQTNCAMPLPTLPPSD